MLLRTRKPSRKPLSRIPDGHLVEEVTGEVYNVVNPRTRWWRLDRWAIWLAGWLSNGRVGCHGSLRFYSVDGKEEVNHFVRRSNVRLPRIPWHDIDDER
jgi:hypothetical protein